MKIAIHVTERVMYQWPLEYWVEFIRKSTDKGNEVYAFSDEPNVKIDDRNPLLFDRTGLKDENAESAIARCDVFVGPPLKYHKMATKYGIKTVAYLGPTTKANGVGADVPCTGCLDLNGERVDCFWGDELCSWHVTPNDILEVIGK